MIEPPAKRIMWLSVVLAAALWWFDAAERERSFVYRGLAPFAAKTGPGLRLIRPG